MSKNVIKEENRIIFAMLSNYLNYAPDYIKKEDIEEIVRLGVSCEYAFGTLLAAAFGLDLVDNIKDRELYHKYFPYMIHKLDARQFYNNPYYKNIKIPSVQIGSCEFRYDTYEPFEGFICDDIFVTEEGRQIPQIGFFETKFKFPAIYENNRLWMSITPNEVNTMKEAVDRAFGNVLTFGLGLGYYTYMVSEKENVSCVTVVEMNEHVIALFNEFILPQCRNAHKIRLIKADAYDYAQKHMSGGNYDFIYTDLWHDVSDGIDLYLKMKSYEKLSPDTVFMYWIEKSILCYL